MVGCGLACPGGGGAGVSGCEFRGSGWGWDRRCQDWGARGLGPGGGGSTEHGTIYIYIYDICIKPFTYVYIMYTHVGFLKLRGPKQMVVSFCLPLTPTPKLPGASRKDRHQERVQFPNLAKAGREDWASS